MNSVPENICKIFDDIIVDSNESRKVFVTIGIFTITRLLRDVEVVVPVVDFCIPQNECVQSVESNPCELFDKLRFPVDEFFPPEKCHFDNLEPSRSDCCCNN